MDIYDLIPLYKILCISIILLVPLLPAWLLYRIAPEDKVLAKGSFSGFQINATGAAAIFIVLFAAIYANIKDINKSVDLIGIYHDRIKVLTDSVVSLQNKRPWTLECEIVSDDNSAITTCLQPNSIQTQPMSINLFPTKRMFSFYVDDDVLKSCRNTYSITFPGNYGTRQLIFNPSTKDSANKIISIIDTLHKNSSDSKFSGNKENMQQVYTINQSRRNLPDSL